MEISRSRAHEITYFNTGDLTPEQENSVELYDKFYSDAGALDRYYGSKRLGFYTSVVESVVKARVCLDGKNVLDCGCGVGYLIAEVSKRYRPKLLTGTDFSEAAVNASKNKFPEYKFYRHDITDPLLDKHDVIFCTEVLEHILDPFLALQNLVNALNPGGVLVLTVPDGRLDTINEHINFWSPESWKVFLERTCAGAIIKTNKMSYGSYNMAIIEQMQQQ